MNSFAYMCRPFFNVCHKCLYGPVSCVILRNSIHISLYRWLKNVQANLEDPGLVEPENEIMLQKLKMYNLPAEAEWLR